MYQVNPKAKTGTCAVLLYKHQRSLCADLGAASTFTIDHLESEENKLLLGKTIQLLQVLFDSLDKARFYYISVSLVLWYMDKMISIGFFHNFMP